MTDEMLEEVCSAKSLGIHPDKELTWIHHVEAIRPKLSSEMIHCPNTAQLQGTDGGQLRPHLRGRVVGSLYEQSAFASVQAKNYKSEIKISRVLSTNYKKCKMLRLPSTYI